jgi:hypothetical protein
VSRCNSNSLHLQKVGRIGHTKKEGRQEGKKDRKKERKKERKRERKKETTKYIKGERSWLPN